MISDGINKRPQASSSIPPRKINVYKFAEARAPELESLHEAVSNRLNNDYRSQRNKRRRTTAHDNKAANKRYRKRKLLGVSVDNANTSALDKDQKKVPRRIRRRIELKKNPGSEFCTSGDGTKRLRTHVWHAKRFTMTKLWGFYLPLGLHGRGRGSRAVLKRFKDGVLLHDASYHVPVQLEGPEDCLMSILHMVLVSQSEDLSGVTYGSAMLYHVGAPHSQPIAPVTYMWRPRQKLDIADSDNGANHNGLGNYEQPEIGLASCFRQLWVWIHASAFSEGYNALQLACQKQMKDKDILVNCFSREGQLAKLEVIGSKADQLLERTLNPFTCVPENPWLLKACSTAKEDVDCLTKKSILEDQLHITSSSMLSLIAQDPRILPEKSLADVMPSPDSLPGIKGNKNTATQGHLEQNGVVIPSVELKPEETTSFTNDDKLWDASSRLLPPEEDHVISMEKHHMLTDFICLREPKLGTGNNFKKIQCSRSCPVMLAKTKNQNGLPIGWSVILPLSWVRVFWNSFVSKSAQAIGLREKHWIANEIGLPSFPSDFPDCNAYSSYMATEAAASDEMAEKRPPAVRPFRVPIHPPWNCVHVALDKLSIGMKDTQVSMTNNVEDSELLANTSCGMSEVSQSGCHDSSFSIVVAKTSTTLISFLNDISGKHLLLFPKVLNEEEGILKYMKDERMLSQGKKQITQINYSRRLCFVRVSLRAFKEGVFEDGAVVCAPSLTDISLWTSSSGSCEAGLTIPQSSVRSYFKELSSGQWELQTPEDPALKESHRLPLGFVTTGFVHGSKKPIAVGFCEAVLLAHLREEQWSGMTVKQRKKEVYVLVRNLRSSAYRLALATIVLEQQEEDVDCL